MYKNDLSIIIVSYNTCLLIDNCLSSIYRSLEKTKLKYEIITVDNGSIDNTIELIKSKYPDVILIKNDKNLGFGKANNQGVKKSNGKYLLFLNSDIEVIGDAICSLYEFLINNKSNIIVGGKLFNLDKSPQSSCGPEYSLINIFIALFLKGDYFNITRYSPNVTKEVDWVMGACFGLSNDFYRKLHGFDEEIFMYMEEIDLNYRAKQHGGSIFFYPFAHFLHIGSGSSKGRQTPILNVFKGFLYFYKKHKPFYQNIILRVILIFKSIFAIILFILLNNKNDQKMYKKALNISLSKV
jgi:GT2 family glycosyltransferase